MALPSLKISHQATISQSWVWILTKFHLQNLGIGRLDSLLLTCQRVNRKFFLTQGQSESIKTILLLKLLPWNYQVLSLNEWFLQPLVHTTLKLPIRIAKALVFQNPLNCFLITILTQIPSGYLPGFLQEEDLIYCLH